MGKKDWVEEWAASGLSWSFYLRITAGLSVNGRDVKTGEIYWCFSIYKTIKATMRNTVSRIPTLMNLLLNFSSGQTLENDTVHLFILSDWESTQISPNEKKDKPALSKNSSKFTTTKWRNNCSKSSFLFRKPAKVFLCCSVLFRDFNSTYWHFLLHSRNICFSSSFGDLFKEYMVDGIKSVSKNLQILNLVEALKDCSELQVSH